MIEDERPLESTPYQRKIHKCQKTERWVHVPRLSNIYGPMDILQTRTGIGQYTLREEHRRLTPRKLIRHPRLVLIKSTWQASHTSISTRLVSTLMLSNASQAHFPRLQSASKQTTYTTLSNLTTGRPRRSLRSVRTPKNNPRAYRLHRFGKSLSVYRPPDQPCRGLPYTSTRKLPKGSFPCALERPVEKKDPDERADWH